MTPARRKQLAVYLRQERAWMKPSPKAGKPAKAKRKG
jgi:hypothetical protein